MSTGIYIFWASLATFLMTEWLFAIWYRYHPFSLELAIESDKATIWDLIGFIYMLSFTSTVTSLLVIIWNFIT